MTLNERKTYKALLLLDLLLKNREFRTTFNGNDRDLEPIFVQMYAKGYVEVQGNNYRITKEGEEFFETFMRRYSEYLKLYDLYSAVDPKTAEFAFERIFELRDKEEEWNQYKNEERFFDLRIAVATYKSQKAVESGNAANSVNPTELVFMSFLNENRFDTNKDGWQFDLLADTLWTEIDNIVNTSITIEQFGGSEAMDNLINKGTKLMFDNINEEIKLKKEALEEAKAWQTANAEAAEEADEDEVEIITTTIVEYEDDLDYYDPYWDICYVSPIWFVPIYVW